jgi:hypothetical protein
VEAIQNKSSCWHRLYVALNCDCCRVNDWEAVRFPKRVKDLIESPARMLIEGRAMEWCEMRLNSNVHSSRAAVLRSMHTASLSDVSFCVAMICVSAT